MTPGTGGSQLSGAEMLDALSSEQRRKWFASLSDDEAEALLHDWAFWARPKQLEPTDRPWVNWLVMAGRGFGKTRVGSEQVRKWVKDFPIVNLIGPTASDVRDVMVQGIGAGSAVMEVCRRDERPVYQKSNRRLVWPNGAISLLFSAEEPERLRGPQHMKVWSDELAAWKYPDEAWEQMEFGLRLGPNPQVVITTTPKPTKLIKELVANPATAVTRGSTYDNKLNLAKNFLHSIIRKYEGTRLGRQELMAELLDDRPGAFRQLPPVGPIGRRESAQEFHRSWALYVQAPSCPFQSTLARSHSLECCAGRAQWPLTWSVGRSLLSRRYKKGRAQIQRTSTCCQC